MRSWASLALLGSLLIAGCAESADPPEPAPVPTEVTPSAPATPEPSPAPSPTPSPSPTPTAQPPQPPAPGARAKLRELREVPRRPRVPEYRRDAFGPRWADVDGNGCNQRDDVLLRDAVRAEVQRQGRCDHDVIAGVWRDPYTGKRLVFSNLKNLRQSQAIQIDHVVPLAEAWRSGAHRWRPQRRLQFANRLGNLLAVDGAANQRKGDGDPAAWRPRKAFQCEYAKRWIRVKHTWDLGADASEKSALRDMLGYC